MDKEYFWARYRSGDWRIAEKRFLNRWFVCGVGHIKNHVIFEGYRSPKSPDDIVEIGEKVICPYK